MTNKFKVGQMVRIKEDANISLDGRILRGKIGIIEDFQLQNERWGKYSYSLDIGLNGVWESELEPLNPLEDLKVGDKVKSERRTLKVLEVRKSYLMEDNGGCIDNTEWLVSELKDSAFRLYTPRKVVKIDGKKYLSADVIKNCKPI